MAIKKHNPTSAAQRFLTTATFEEVTTRKPSDFYPTTEAEQEIRRRAAGESIKRIIQFLILFWRITETKHQSLK